MKTLLIMALLLASTSVDAQQEPAEDWPLDLVDPGHTDAPADLMLPMPCGAAMAFQKVDVPVDVNDPLADRRVRLGQSLDQTGYSDYLRPAFLRGPFGDPGEAADDGASTETSHYYIARYELTKGQFRTLQGDCSPPSRADRLTKGGLSWFEGVSLAQTYSSWLYANASGALPRANGVPGFVRLPTGVEWEYATRGGARIDATRFSGLTFFAGQEDQEMSDFALYLTPGGRGRLGAIGLRRPNPLGLYDVYGNAEELMLDVFRLNAFGRSGGQLGGIVTRGGSVLSNAQEIYSAQRTEYPPFNTATGAPQAGETFGVRLVLASHITTTDTITRKIRERWLALASAPADTDSDIDPVTRLSVMIEAETDPRRELALSVLQLEFRRSRDRTQTALQQSARATFLAGAVFVQTLNASEARIVDKVGRVRQIVALPLTVDNSAMINRQIQSHLDQLEQMRGGQAANLLSYRAALETLSADMPGAVRDVAYRVLREELVLSAQVDLLLTLDRFWRDLQIYRQAPDIDPEKLLQIVLD